MASWSLLKNLCLGVPVRSLREPLQTFLLLIYWWVQQYPVTQAARESELAKGTTVDVYQWLREICSWRLINHDDMTLGRSAPVHTNVVQVDESCFSHASSALCKDARNIFLFSLTFMQ